jgi:hypothetical protein
MKREHVRKLIAEGMIGVSLCAGVSHGLIKPWGEQMDAQRAAAFDPALTQAVTLLLPDTAHITHDRLHEKVEKYRTIEKHSAPARDELVAFERLMELAEAASVTVLHLQATDDAPAVVERPRDDAQALDDAGAPSAAQDMQVGYVLTVRGEYAQVAQLLTLVTSDESPTLVARLLLTPSESDGPTLVTAEIETRHIAIDCTRAEQAAQRAITAMDALEGSR